MVATRSFFLCLVLTSLALGAPPPARAEPELALRADWFRIVDPYRYVEARRFERGWNRGAGAETSGTVRAPVAGRVRFVGSIAGRQVVTIATRIDGRPVVVTLTGLADTRIREGELLRAGRIVGSGHRVHVGAYDPARRSHYFRVRQADGAVAVGRSADAGRSISGAVGRRLIDAVEGRASFIAPASGHVDPRGSAGGEPISLTTAPVAPRVLPRTFERIGRSLRSAPTLDARPGRQRIATPTTPSTSTGRGAGAGTGRSWRIRSSGVGVSGTSSATLVGFPVDAYDARVTSEPSVSTMVRSRGADAGVAPPAAGGGQSSGDPGASAPVVPTTHDRAAAAAIVEGEPAVAVRGSSNASRVVTRDSGGTDASVVGAVLAVLALVGLVVTARRRRARRESVPEPHPVQAPIELLLPHVHRPRRFAAYAHRDAVADALAWSDGRSGTSLDTTHERAARSTDEQRHELLRHHADLLRELDPAPGARVHHDRC